MKLRKGMIFSLAKKFQLEGVPKFFKIVKTKNYAHHPPGGRKFNGLSVTFVTSNDIDSFPPDSIVDDKEERSAYPHDAVYWCEVFYVKNWVKLDRRKRQK